MMVLKSTIFVVLSTFMQHIHLFTCEHNGFYANHRTLRRTNRLVEPRIVNGSEATLNEYPYFVQLYILTNLNEYEWSFCGGTLVHPKWVLTAAHCVVDSKAIIAKIGFYNVTTSCEEEDPDAGCYLINPKHTYVHPEYEMYLNEADFALLELEQNLGKEVPRINKDYFFPNVNDTVTAIGRGQTEEGDISFVVMHTDLVVVSHDECEMTYESDISTNMLCATGYGKTSACFGDSGGPLVVKSHDVDDPDVLVGVASMVSYEGCSSANYPNIFSRVSSVISWIFSTAPEVDMDNR